ncbi:MULTISPECIES: SMI1/KNR4 family protein [unclassified Variovorax]|uniref:SMI1/KNR4 family protein n=1 Tax=unclassified Variovorax TaxID=663243 RepID=UPI003F48CD6F
MTDILSRLQTLKRLDLDCSCFAAKAHWYDLNPPLSEEEVAQVEAKHQCRFPDEYRRFITEIGNGGAGPAYGVFPLGMQDQSHDLSSWDDGYKLVGDLSKPFPLRSAWNLPDDFWSQQPDPPEDMPVDEQDRLHEAWDKRLESDYYATSITDGAIPICHEGCALRNWLVVSGPLAGTVWRDLRADYGGIEPFLNKDGTPMGFNDWYLHWVEQNIQQVSESQAQTRFSEAFSLRLSKLSNPKAAAFAIFCAQALYPNLEAYASAIGFGKEFALQDRLDEVLWAQLLLQHFELPVECDEMVDGMLGVQHDLARHLSSTKTPSPDNAGMKAAIFSYIAACAFWFDKGSPQQLLAATQGAVTGDPMLNVAESELRWAFDQLESEPSEWAPAGTVESLRNRAKACKIFLSPDASEPDAPSAIASAKHPWWKRWLSATSN